VLVAATALAGLAIAAPPYTRATSFVARVADVGGWREAAAEWSASSFTVHDVQVPSRAATIRARLYRPADIRRGAVLVPGLHPHGIDERRLVAFARELAASGFSILTPEIPDLTRFRITPSVVDHIEDAAAWLAGQKGDSPAGRVGVMGISFSGGLSVVAAGRERLRDRTEFVFSLGGHGDLARVLRFLCTGVASDGSTLRPHDYGLAVVALTLAPQLVPPEQVAGLVEGTETFLMASALDHLKDARAKALFERARAIERTLPEPAARVLRLVNTRDVEGLGPTLLPHLPVLTSEPSLSPERAPPPGAPVYLLHGTGDIVVPAAESVLLGRYLRGHGVETHVLLTPLITHAEVEQPPDLIDTWHLVGFWKNLLEE
jgi:dienelactone hydrolase